VDAVVVGVGEPERREHECRVARGHGRRQRVDDRVGPDAVVPVAWLCGHSKAPDKMVAKGADKTDVAERYLPMNCR